MRARLRSAGKTLLMRPETEISVPWPGISTRTSQTPQPLSLCFELIGVDTSTPLLRDSIHHTGKEGTHSLNTEIHDYLDGLYSEQKAPQFGGPWFNTMLSGDRWQSTSPAAIRPH